MSESSAARYELYYWPMLQGRGEFVRLALEEAGAPYVDVARLPEGEAGGVQALLSLLREGPAAPPPFAPPILKVGEFVIAQTANILLYLGRHHALAPQDESGQLSANQLQLTVTDLVAEVHDTHHPISSALYYEDQKREAKQRATSFIDQRLPRYLGYFELRDHVARRLRIAAYLASERRIPFNEAGIFRHYPELDAAGS